MTRTLPTPALHRERAHVEWQLSVAALQIAFNARNCTSLLSGSPEARALIALADKHAEIVDELARRSAAEDIEPPEPQIWSQADLDRAGDRAASAEQAVRMGGHSV